MMEVAGAQARAVPLLLRNTASLRTSVSVSCTGSRRSWVAAATAEGDETRGFDKVPMDTPGAYRLVDRDTGRSVIVWGGTDDSDEASMPSPAVLSRTTDRRHSQGYNHTTPPLTETHCLIPRLVLGANRVQPFRIRSLSSYSMYKRRIKNATDFQL